MNPRLLIASLALVVLAGGIFLMRHTRDTQPAATPAVAEKTSPRPATPTSPQPRLSPGIQLITDAGRHWEERIAAVQALPTQLGEPTVDFLFAYLSSPHDGNEEERYLICNEIMEVFRERSLAPSLYNQHLCALISAPSADPVIRDYAAQHLALWISGTSAEATEPDPALIPRAIETMLQAASLPENSQLTLSGTIFQSLAHSISSGSEEMQSHRPAVIEKALQVIADPSFSTVNRSSAMQAAAQLNASELRETSLAFAQNPQTPADLRLSAIAALGNIGHTTDTTFLERLSQDPTYHYAAAAALQNLSNRPINE